MRLYSITMSLIGCSFLLAYWELFLMPAELMMIAIWFLPLPGVGAVALIFYRIRMNQCSDQVDWIPKWKIPIKYMRRDNVVVELKGTRAYPGESIIDVPELGLIEFLGKDCFYSWGDKKIVWGLENINFTPDPRYSNLNHLMWEIGFRTSEDPKRVLDPQSEEDLQYMAIVYMKMLEYDENSGVKKLVKEMKEYDGKVVKFEPPEDKKDDVQIREILDGIKVE